MAEDTGNDEKVVFPFHEMGLDDRVLKAIAKLGWIKPTLIQERAIPLIIDGRDLLARGRTGSGKTGAFCIPLVQRILDVKAQHSSQTALQAIRGCVLCPSRELARQTFEVLQSLTSSCGGIIRILDLGTKDVATMKPLLSDVPDIIVGTPGRLAEHLKAANLNLDALTNLIIDEADLIFSFGYEADLRIILAKLPSIYQAILTSATITEDVTKLKKLVLNNPVILKLSEPQLPDSSQLSQYVIKLEEEDKLVLIYALFRLELIRGKTLIFVSSVDRCYRTKLFLEQFSIPCCVLNSELPVATRLHTVAQFNKGVYNVIVAADEKLLDEHTPSKEETKSNRSQDKESGVARGIDFNFVSNVINFDFPTNPESYVHRVGRTARGTQQGTALSLVNAAENNSLAHVEKHLSNWGEGSDDDGTSGKYLKPYQFNMAELDGFRYRARDAMRSITKIAVKEARLKEIKGELLNSQKLSSYFEDNPRDLELLRHDKALHTVKHLEHLKNVPEYIVPETLKAMTGMASSKKRGNRKRKGGQFKTQTQKKFLKKAADPLQLQISKTKK